MNPARGEMCCAISRARINCRSGACASNAMTRFSSATTRMRSCAHSVTIGAEAEPPARVARALEGRVVVIGLREMDFG